MFTTCHIEVVSLLKFPAFKQIISVIAARSDHEVRGYRFAGGARGVQAMQYR